MKQTLLALFLATSMATPTIATEQSPNYCDDQASWQQWQQLLADNPTDGSVASLYAFRIGLFYVRSGKISTQRATKPFEQLRDAVVRGKLEEMDAGRVEL